MKITGFLWVGTTFLAMFVVCSVLGIKPDDPMFNGVKEIRNAMSLDLIPSDINPDVTYLSLNDNLLTSIGPHDLTGFSYMLLLDLGMNQINVVDDLAFSGTPIVYLALNDNELSGDIPNVCPLNATLSVLRLDRNRLTSASNPRLSCLRNLTLLDLHGNDLTCFPELPVLHNPHLLEVFSIGGNELNITSPLPLDNLTSLAQLSMG